MSLAKIMVIKKEEPEEKPKNLWKDVVDGNKYQLCVTISSIDSTIELEEVDEKVVYMKDLEKRKEVYGICGECNEPGTGWKWCQPCNVKRLEENFKNWTSGNKDIDELMQHSQLNATYCYNCLEWIPFENFQKVTYITRGGFGKIYSAEWPEGYIFSWDIENQQWKKFSEFVVLKSLDNSSDIGTDFLNEVKSHLQFYLCSVVPCYGITQNPDTKDYMMVLGYCKDGNLRNYLNQSEDIDYVSKIKILSQIARGLLDIHNAEKVHRDFHSGNILLVISSSITFISDLGLCQPANNEKKKGVYGVLPYVSPEVLHGSQYTKASDIYSFGIIMNELISEEIPYNDIPHDQILTFSICKGLRPKISEDTPKLLADLIMKCWDVKSENRPTAKELDQILNKWNIECGGGGYSGADDSSDDDSNDNKSGNQIDKNSEIYIQIEECRKIKENKPVKNKPKTIHQTHSQAIYTSRLLNFKNLPEPVNSSDLSPFQNNTDSMLSSVAIQFQNMWSELDSEKPKQDDQNEG